MNVTCPKCKHEFRIKVTAQAIKEQTLFFVIKYQGDLLQAKTVWDSIKNFESLMKMGAKDLGTKATTYIRSITNKPHELKVEFVVVCDMPEFGKTLINGLNAAIEKVEKHENL